MCVFKWNSRNEWACESFVLLAYGIPPSSFLTWLAINFDIHRLWSACHCRWWLLLVLLPVCLFSLCFISDDHDDDDGIDFTNTSRYVCWNFFSLCSFMHLARSTFFRFVSFSLPLASYMLSLSIGLSVCLGFSARGTWPMITSITLIIHLFITGKVASAWVRVVCRVPAVVAVVVAAAAFLFSHHC